MVAVLYCAKTLRRFAFLLVYTRLSMGEVVDQLITVEGVGPRFDVSLHPPIMLDDAYTYTLSLRKFQMYNSFPNISPGVNNQLKVDPGTGTFHTIALDKGAYELSAIQHNISLALQKLQVEEPDKHFKLEANISTFRSVLFLDDKWKVDFNVAASIAEVLGFEKTDKYEGKGHFTSKNIVDIQTYPTIIFLVNAIVPSYFKDSLGAAHLLPIVHQHFIKEQAGFKIVDRPTSLVHKRVDRSVLDTFTVLMQDHHRKPLDCNGESATIELLLRATRK